MNSQALLLAQLRFELLKTLFRGLLHGGAGTGGNGPGGLKSCELASIAPASGQDRAAALHAVAPLGLFISSPPRPTSPTTANLKGKL